MIDDVRLSDENVSGLAIGFDKTRLQVAVQSLGDAAQSHAVGQALGEELRADDLAGIFVLSDGLAVNGSTLVDGLRSALGDKVVISGGLAGDGARFQDTLVMVDAQATNGLVAAVGFYGSAVRFAHGTAGGWDEFGPIRKITKSVGSVLYELDGKPALDLYETYLGEEAAELPAAGLLYPLKIWNSDAAGDQVVRTILSIDREARSMTFAGDMPEGTNARLMRGSFENLVDGAAQAAIHARNVMGQDAADPQLCLLVSCVGRRLLMGQRTADEVEAVGEALGTNTSLAGFYSYGEIAPHNESGICSLHNQTVTITLIAEAA